MTDLTIYAASGEPLERHDDPATIAAALEPAGIRLERWPVRDGLPPAAGQDEVLAAYAPEVERVKEDLGLHTVDVVALRPDHPDRAALRAKFIDEHVHHDFEVRFFVDGSGLFYFHLGDRVYALTCRAGDFVSVPAGTPHWFDMGPEPDFKCIRFFGVKDGWVADFTGETIASQFPRYGE